LIPETEEKFSDFNNGEFWRNLLKIADKLGFECNKATILWTNKPLPSPEDMHAVLGAAELASVALLNSFHSFSGFTQGQTIKEYLKAGITTVLESMVTFANILFQSVGKTYSSPDDHPLVLQCGVVMKQCDSLKVLPQQNSAAVAAKLLSHAELIKDALRELEEAKSSETFMEDFECEENWSEADQIILSPMLGMIKSCGALTKKTLDAAKKSDASEKLKIDAIPALFKNIPELVDNLSLSLYPPLDWEVSKKEAWILKDCLESIITELQNILGAGHLSWLEFVLKAVRHNTATIQAILIQHGMAQLKLTDTHKATIEES